MSGKICLLWSKAVDNPGFLLYHDVVCKRKESNMIKKETIDRINELAHKYKTVGLTEEEFEERHRLRMEYLEGFRANFKAQLKNVKFVEDLTEEELKEEVELMRKSEGNH